MKYEIFVRLFHEAKKFDNPDIFIANQGWQDWMNDEIISEDGKDGDISVNAPRVPELLLRIYEYAHMDFKALRKESGLTQVQMASAYYVSRRTVENWERRGVPDTTFSLLAFVVGGAEL